MAFAIEVPGEAAPLNPQQVYLALQSAGSSQQLAIQTGTQQLEAWVTQRGYYTLLQVLVSSTVKYENDKLMLLLRQYISISLYPPK